MEIGPLVILPKGQRINAKRYLEMVKEHFVLFYKRIIKKYRKGVVMQEDNALWHIINAIRVYLIKQRV